MGLGLLEWYQHKCKCRQPGTSASNTLILLKETNINCRLYSSALGLIWHMVPGHTWPWAGLVQQCSGTHTVPTLHAYEQYSTLPWWYILPWWTLSQWIISYTAAWLRQRVGKLQVQSQAPVSLSHKIPRRNFRGSKWQKGNYIYVMRVCMSSSLKCFCGKQVMDADQYGLILLCLCIHGFWHTFILVLVVSWANFETERQQNARWWMSQDGKWSLGVTGCFILHFPCSVI